MQSIRPSQLTNEELLRHVYMVGTEALSKELVEELCQRIAGLIDEVAAREKVDTDDAHQEGFEEGFTAGVAHANDSELN